MNDEKPISLKKKRQRHSSGECKVCIIHYIDLKITEELKSITNYGWRRIQEVKEMRLRSIDTCARQSHICEQIPQNLNCEIHRYHRQCYQKFTNIKYILKRKTSDTESSFQALKRQRLQQSKGLLFSPDLCIICNRRSRYINRKKDPLVKCITESAKQSIREAALRRQDHRVMGLTENYCLVAKEAHYHTSCRKEFTRKEERNAEGQDEESKDRRNAHKHAFDYIRKYVDRYIIEGSNVERMMMLKEKYCLYMQEHFPLFYNASYKTDKLKEKLKSVFGDRLQFWTPNYKSELVYSTDLSSGHAVESTFESAASDQRRLDEAALTLRRLIFDASKEETNMQWPPTAEELKEKSKRVPPLLYTFLASLLRKPGSEKHGQRRERILLCRCVERDENICYTLICDLIRKKIIEETS